MRVVLALVLLVVSACSTIVPTPTPTSVPTATPSPQPSSMPIWTSASLAPTDACRSALGGGILVADSRSGLGFSSGERLIRVYWPFGYAARLEADRLALVDPEGQIVARVGDTIGTAGGYGADGEWIVCPASSIEVLSTQPP